MNNKQIKDKNKAIIDKLFELYVIIVKKYLQQHSYGYITVDSGKKKKNSEKYYKPLSVWQMASHLEKEFTVGVFGGKVHNKFLAFDVDFIDEQKARWVTYKICQTLDELKVNNYYISYSGNKGYHIDLFFENLINITMAKKFYNLVLDRAGVRKYFEKEQAVEFRATDGLGYKLPLGVHQKTGKYCGFCTPINDGMQVMSEEESIDYLFEIKKINSDIIADILEFDSWTPPSNVTVNDYIQVEEDIAPHKELESYNQSEDNSIDRAMDYLNNGLKMKGTRHNAIRMIASYLKYAGHEENECKEILLDWMENQDKEMYSTVLKDCLKDIDDTTKYVYNNDFNIKQPEKNISVTFQEITAIILSCPQKNQKLIAYALLIHSKRFALKNGVFFMAYSDLTKATGLTRQALIELVTKLELLGVIKIVRRNDIIKGTKKIRRVNKYMVALNMENLESDDDTPVFMTEDQNSFKQCVLNYYTEDELKKKFSSKQYKSLIG